MSIALVTNYLPPYRLPLYELLAERHGLEVFCFGGEGDYVPEAMRDLDAQIERARFPAHRLKRQRDAATLARHHDAVIASTTGRIALPSAYRGARRTGKPFLLWASLWRHPRTLAHAASYPLMRRLYRNSDAILTYGPHVSRYVSKIRGDSEKVFVAPQAVEAELFGRSVAPEEVEEFRAALGLAPDGEPLILFAGRLVPEKGVGWLLRVWRKVGEPRGATLCLAGDGPLAQKAATQRSVRLVGRLARTQLPLAYASADALVVPSLRTRGFLEPWGLVCNEAMLQGTPVVASTAVGAAAGGLVRDGETGLVVSANRDRPLADALDSVIRDPKLVASLGANARAAVADYTHERAAGAFGRALAAAGVHP